MPLLYFITRTYSSESSSAQMMTDSFKSVIAAAVPPEKRLQLVEDLLTLFCDSAAPNDDYHAAIPDIDNHSRSDDKSSSSDGIMGRTFRFWKSPLGSSSSGVEKSDSDDPAFSQASELLGKVKASEVQSEYERLAAGECLYKLNNSGLIMEGPGGRMKNLTYRGYEDISEPLKVLGRTVSELDENVSVKLPTKLVAFDMVVRKVVWFAMRLVESVCEKAFRYPTFSRKYAELVGQANIAVSHIQASCGTDGSWLVGNVVKMVSAYIDLRRIQDEINDADPPEDCPLDGNTEIKKYKIKQKDLAEPGVLNKLLTKDCGLPVIAAKLREELGRGGFSAVSKAVIYDGATEKTVAIKVLNAPLGDPERRWRIPLRLLREVEMYMEVNADEGAEGAQYSARLLGIWMPKPDCQPGLVMEYADGGNLESYVQELNGTERGNKLKERLLKSSEVIQGVKYLHGLEPRIIHGDLKTANILIVNGRACLGDFGLARFAIERTGFTTNVQAYTNVYRAPEIYYETQRIPTSETDIYAYGCLFLEVMSGAQLTEHLKKSSTNAENVLRRHGTPIHGLSKQSANGLEIVTPKLFSKDPSEARPFEKRYVTMLEKCLSFNATDRPTAEQLVDEVRGFL